jgi:hypothetical protein
LNDGPVGLTTVADEIEAGVECDLLRSAGVECGHRAAEQRIRRFTVSYLMARKERSTLA